MPKITCRGLERYWTCQILLRALSYCSRINSLQEKYLSLRLTTSGHSALMGIGIHICLASLQGYSVKFSGSWRTTSLHLAAPGISVRLGLGKKAPGPFADQAQQGNSC